MGFIQKIFGGIFSFLGGILKIFGIGKSDYYMEAESTPKPATSSKPAPEAKPTPTSTPPVAAAPKPAPTPVATAPAPATLSKPNPSPVLENFATKFSMSPSTKRRRPGPSLTPFMDMARRVKTPTA
ncbi:MAG TPA: hypothetical protein V6D20_09780 [Candidatus Obscuribacterales bacterium]